MKYLFGPVPSRRLGISLGVDLTPCKICSFDCIYCQLGRTKNKTLERKEYVPVKSVLAELKAFLENGREADYITLSGSGEPTLNSKFGWLLKEIKGLTDTPVAVITNSSLLSSKKIREGLNQADVVLPSLDAVSQSVFETINRPHPGLNISGIMESLIKFTRGFQGEVWLEVMLVEGLNDIKEELESMRIVLDMIDADKTQLNTVVRPPSEVHAKPLSEERMNEIAELLDAEVIAETRRRDVKTYKEDVEELIAEMLERRPCTLKDISSSLGLNKNEVLKYIQVLESGGKVVAETRGESRYFRGVVE